MGGIVAQYRNNILTRVERFVAAARAAKQWREARLSRAAAIENVLSTESAREAVRLGGQEALRLRELGHPATHGVEVVVKRLRRAVLPEGLA